MWPNLYFPGIRRDKTQVTKPKSDSGSWMMMTSICDDDDIWDDLIWEISFDDDSFHLGLDDIILDDYDDIYLG